MNVPVTGTSEFSGGPALCVSNLCKAYGNQQVLRNVSFQALAGEVIGVVGPNGAGKTTLLMALSGFLEPQSGKIEVLGHKVESGRSPPETVFIPDDAPFYGFFPAWEHLRMWSKLAGKVSSPVVLGDCLLRAGLPKADWKKKVSKFSRGMRQRLALAHAIMAGPKLLLLDESTAGLDPEGTALARDLVSEFSENGATVLLSSHSMNEVSRLCHRVFFLAHGQLCLLERHKRAGYFARFEVQIENLTPEQLQKVRENVSEVKSSGNCLQLLFSKSVSLGECAALLSGLDIQVTSITDMGSSLEERFFEQLENRD